MAVRIKFHHTAKVFKELYQQEKNEKQKKRYHAMYLLSNKYAVGDVSDIIVVSRRMINKWVKLYEKHGLEGLLIKKYPGAKPKIDKNLRKELVLLMQTPPRQIGFHFSTWNTKTIKMWFKEVHKIDVTKPRIFQILKKEKFSWKKGAHKYVLADENEQKRFIRNVRKVFRQLAPNQIALFEDECSVSQHPRLTHMWMKTGTIIEIPTLGNHKKKEFSDP
ncbi:MAG: helix-turn-helix domain-containing protein [Nanoarchaeota archaeon]